MQLSKIVWNDRENRKQRFRNKPFLRQWNTMGGHRKTNHSRISEVQKMKSSLNLRKSTILIKRYIYVVFSVVYYRKSPVSTQTTRSRQWVLWTYVVSWASRVSNMSRIAIIIATYFHLAHYNNVLKPLTKESRKREEFLLHKRGKPWQREWNDRRAISNSYSKHADFLKTTNRAFSNSSQLTGQAFATLVNTYFTF